MGERKGNAYTVFGFHASISPGYKFHIISVNFIMLNFNNRKELLRTDYQKLLILLSWTYLVARIRLPFELNEQHNIGIHGKIL